MANANRFPHGFRWGSATAAHQIEGGNTNNDWWRWEHASGSGVAEPSGDACDSWNRWPEDVELVADLGLDHYRFSLEWSRIEPAPGEWSHAAVDHYRRVAAALWERGIEPVVTFHHFTTPTWLADRGGWESPDTAERYADYCQFAAGALRDELGRACTLNEPNVVATMGWVMGMFPPGKTDPALAEAATTNLAAAHRKGVEAIRAAAPGVPVGLTLSMTDYQPVGRNGASASASDSASDGHGDSEPDPAAVRRVDKIRATHEDVFLHATAGDDFLGVQTYSRMRIDAEGWAGPQPGVPTLPMGYEYWPQALEACLRRAWAVTGGRIPLWVTENGIGTDDDEQRQRFIGEALEGVLRAMADGIDVLGYTYWSLMDNFEWTFGYGPKFGLIAVDRSSFTRSPKPSAAWFASVAKAGYLP